MHSEAVTAAGAALIRFARSCGLIRGEWIAIDGSKFRAVASVDSTRERLELQRYLESIKKADEEQQANIDPSAVQAAVKRLKEHLNLRLVTCWCDRPRFRPITSRQPSMRSTR
jgi:hypothetical protein